MNRMKTKIVSDCHKAPIIGEAGIGDFHDNEKGVTMSAICKKCGKPCNFYKPVLKRK